MIGNYLFRYGLSCGLLTLPILLWNALFSRYLPPAFEWEEFWRDIPPFIAYGENALRLIVVLVPFLMPLELSTIVQRRGLFLFLAGTVVYCSAWLALIFFPLSTWSTSSAGFLSPAYTPLIWLTGLGLMGRALYWSSRYRPWMYLAASWCFVAFHVVHTWIVYGQHY